MFEIEISPEEITSAELFSEKVLSTVLGYYKNRNQYDIEIIKHQTFIGKMGEFGVRAWLIKNGAQCSAINLDVTYDKSFDADLLIRENIKCHVKSQDIISAKKFGTSWTFQYAGRGNGHRDSEIFDNYNHDDLIVFCLVDNPKVYVCAIINVYQLHELGLFGEPKKESLIGVKKVVYLDSIPNKYKVSLDN